jgi:hypothetical protein
LEVNLLLLLLWRLLMLLFLLLHGLSENQILLLLLHWIEAYLTLTRKTFGISEILK